MKKTLAELIDELSVVNIKIFFLIEKIQNNEHTKAEAKKVQDLNKIRSTLKNAINQFSNENQEIKI